MGDQPSARSRQSGDIVNRDWMDQAACAHHPQAHTWIKPRARQVPKHIAQTCGACPVKKECLKDEIEYAAQTYRWTYKPAGYRAGLTPAQLQALIHQHLKNNPISEARK
ncbi:WhiB family transcriptional regulator [Actinomyces sp.]|uniref:WhiB family transcriptional regulator n=1 Tax=Actinomyces sp. TaxID=29317 RepID=UPI0039775F7A